MKIDKMISFDTIVVQKVGLDATDIDGEIVMMDIDKGKYYGFNSVGSRIWELIKNPIAIKEIKSALLKEYNVDTKTCEEAVLTFLNRLNDEELISVS
ncbi:lasso peptide biosynthesis PqqD family chaperone [Clostridium sp. JS66]|uniref:lasso peptide biosynthesis PqqD family chaperone n=1 Tax=Clostridium sp. JS66 TaxID=3064705 RepID=UPI00298E2AB6|nr:lasso peptide biosynthesis PqqD family chaperone [Clostridium sp. JS66]WPC43292.1 lasso peptide biosynthesis PqqD family chaperone [Clostridium sp. JS66]